MFKLRTVAIGLSLAIMAALGVGAALGVPLVSTTAAHSGHHLINARVMQTVDNQGVSARIRTDHPGAMSDYYFSYTRIAVSYDPSLDSNHTSGECTGHCYGEIGPFIAGPDYAEGTTNGKVIPLIVFQNQYGRESDYVSGTLADNSYHTWKVVNNKTCGNSGTATATTGEVANREDAASRGIAVAMAHDNITTKNAYVGEMTWAEYIQGKGGEMGPDVEGRDDDVWVVAIEPTSDIVRNERDGPATYSTFQVAFMKATGRVVGVSHYFTDKYTVVPMTDDYKVVPRD